MGWRLKEIRWTGDDILHRLPSDADGPVGWFERRTERRGNKRDKIEHLWLFRNDAGQIIVMRSSQRQRVACGRRLQCEEALDQAAAYVSLMGTVEGFPEVELLP